MDYFFVIEFNGQSANAQQVMENIVDLGCEMKYLAADMSGKGVLGIVESPTIAQRDSFFENIAYFVQKINGLPDGSYAPKGGGGSYNEELATWAYTTTGDLVDGLKRLEYDGDGLLPYQIETILRGGVTGVHGG